MKAKFFAATLTASLLLGQAKLHPEDAETVGKAAQDMQLLSTPPVTADTNTIQNIFMQIVRDIKKNAEPTAEA